MCQQQSEYQSVIEWIMYDGTLTYFIQIEQGICYKMLGVCSNMHIYKYIKFIIVHESFICQNLYK